ncbi:hypothetical protein AC1031_000739 [Aphanomyces cochlioides]|nr:hypothetical protein AC1031_000739 [Aphanomyces cochlioides]
MLPPNTMYFLQPQDAGVIHMFKAKVNRLKAKYFIRKFDEWLANRDDGSKENDERDISRLHEVSVLQAMEWAKEAWLEVSSTSISNCWRHTQILDEEMYELVHSMSLSNI